MSPWHRVFAATQMAEDDQRRTAPLSTGRSADATVRAERSWSQAWLAVSQAAGSLQGLLRGGFGSRA
jgi:hypothetical protein